MLAYDKDKRKPVMEYQERKKAHDQAMQSYDDWLIRTKADFWRNLSGLQFESEIARLFLHARYQVAQTPATGDEGIDLVLRKAGKTIVVQCKAHHQPVGPSVVRELYGAMIHARADEAILVSLDRFTRGVFDFAKGKPIQLMSLLDILRLQD